ncbi:MAG TPA: acyltransferase [Dokdonella sp.]|uniref:acyltransferase family protein n=1 Tax=Dokdonella sp. TaxID=2291710 RepID=UPI002D7E6E9F|nr:acyltransferase [Dokdonella sp.]HET9033809.1 acyltransferase [Dokdonella sp.]
MSIPSERQVLGARRNLDIECLRAVAVIGVVFHHMQGNLFHPRLAWIDKLFHRADFWFGVDLFLAISGFVIARSFLPQMSTSRGDRDEQVGVIGAFWIRRFWRLLPSAWLWLGLIMLAVVAFNHSGAFGSVHANLMATLAGIFNVANFRFADAFFRYEYGTSFVYWSLSLEEQFYLLLPLLALALHRRIGLLMVGIVLLQLCLFRTPVLMSVRTDALALGVLLAIAAPRAGYEKLSPRFLLRLHWLRSVLPLVLLATMAMLASGDLGDWRFRISAIAVLSAALVWLASYDRDYLLPTGWCKNLLVWIGARSYAIYLIHVPVYFLLREICFRLGTAQGSPAHPSAWLMTVLACGLIALLADLNYRYLEQPLRLRGRRIADRFRQRRTSRQALVVSRAYPDSSNIDPGA